MATKIVPFDANQHSGLVAAAHFQARGDDAGLHLARDLEHRIPGVFRKYRPDLSGFEIFTVDSSVPYGKKEIVRRMQDEKGKAGWVGNGANDLGNVTITREEEKTPYRRFGIAMCITEEDFEAAAASPEGVDLFAEDQMAMARSLGEFANDIMWKGDSAQKLWGLVNLPHVSVLKSKKLTKEMTATEWLEEMNGCVTASFVNSKGRYRANLLLMGLEDYRYIAETYRSDTSDLTILAAFQMTNPGVTVRGVHEMDSLGDKGPCMAAFNTDPQMIRAFISPWKFLPLQVVNGGLQYVQVALAKHGGLISPYPGSIIIKRMRRS